MTWGLLGAIVSDLGLLVLRRGGWLGVHFVVKLGTQKRGVLLMNGASSRLRVGARSRGRGSRPGYFLELSHYNI